MLDLKAKPFYLNEEDITWVQETLASMTLEQKAGQVFCPMGFSADPTVLRHLICDIGVYFDREINNRLRGVSRMASLEIVLERAEREFSQAEKEVLADQKNELYKKLLANMSPSDLSDEVKSALDELRRRGYLLAIGSSSKNAPFILRQIGLGDYFDAVSDGNNISRSKPDPEVFIKASEMLGIPADRCLVVEDAISGAEAAHAGGMKAACVGDASRSGVGDYNMGSVAELLQLLP